MIIKVHVTPNSKLPQVTRLDESSYDVRVDAKATGGKANRQLLEILSNHFGVPKSGIFLIRGAKSRDKTIELIFSKGDSPVKQQAKFAGK